MTIIPWTSTPIISSYWSEMLKYPHIWVCIKCELEEHSRNINILESETLQPIQTIPYLYTTKCDKHMEVY